MTTSISYLSTYPPRRCGIAQFTRDLRAAVGREGSVFALARASTGVPPQASWPAEVADVIVDDDPNDYRVAARRINASGVDVLSVQHEFGLYGGPDGDAILGFLDRLHLPVVTTLHTVPASPTRGQRRVLEAIAQRADRLVVMSEAAAARLMSGYDLGSTSVDTIPHGVPDLPLHPVGPVRAELGLRGRRVVISFGLVGPGKGFEHAIEAMAMVREAIPDALYVILGATHPDLLARDGESYRESLMELVARRDLEGSVRFEDRFVDRMELSRWLAASDVFVTPYPNLDQVVSGTLAYALGAGLAIVSTPYAHAAELLAGGGGVLVPPADPARLATALIEVLGDDAHRLRLRTRALASGAPMRWPVVGRSYRSLFDDVADPSRVPVDVSRAPAVPAGAPASDRVAARPAEPARHAEPAGAPTR